MAFDDKIYLDYNATTPLAEEVILSITQCLKSGWANPSSNYGPGRNAKEMVEKARCQVADMISAKSNEIIFTSGGTEANNLVIHTALEHYKLNGTNPAEVYSELNEGRLRVPHVVTTTIEHDAIKLPLASLEKRGEIEVTFLPVSKVTGCVELNDVISALKLNTCLVTVMLANNETGVIQPVREISLAVHNWSEQNKRFLASPIFVHTDAAQAIGKIPVDVTFFAVDYLTIVGHKFYGPRIGALYVRDLGKACPLYPQFFGGGQERGYRPGTENTPMIVGLGIASELVTNNLVNYTKHFDERRTYLENKLLETFGELIRFNSHCGMAASLPNTVNVSILGENLKGYKVLSYCNRLLASVGAACHSQGSASSILLASGVPLHVAENAVRLSIGRETTQTDIDDAISDLSQAIQTVNMIANS